MPFTWQLRVQRQGGGNTHHVDAAVQYLFHHGQAAYAASHHDWHGCSGCNVFGEFQKVGFARKGAAIAGIALFAWGTIELFIVDKTLRPRLVGGPIKLPFLPTFFGLVGGVTTMGLVGLFVGPVLMALLVGIWREWVLSLHPAGETPPPRT